MMAVNRPFGNVTVTPARALIAVSPDPYVFTASTARAAPISVATAVTDTRLSSTSRR